MTGLERDIDDIRTKLLLLGDPVVDPGKNPADDVAKDEGHNQKPQSGAPREHTKSCRCGHHMQAHHPSRELLAHTASQNQDPDEVHNYGKPRHC